MPTTPTLNRPALLWLLGNPDTTGTPRTTPPALTRAIRTTAERHGAADVHPVTAWQRDGADIAHAIAEHLNVALARDYMTHYRRGAAHAAGRHGPFRTTYTPTPHATT